MFKVMMRCVLVAALGAGGLAAGGCGDSDSSVDPVRVQVSGVIVDAMTSEPLSGVELCIENSTDVACATTDAAGQYTLANVPGNSLLVLVATLDGYLTGVAGFATGSADLDLGQATALDRATADQNFSLLGVTEDPSLGHVAYFVSDGVDGNDANVAGVSFAPAPAGEATVYASAEGVPDPDATATSTSGLAVTVNVPPGTCSVSLTGLPPGCATLWGWGGSGTVRAPIRAGALSALVVECVE